jgi:tRNA A-37 threonylcarbamoyl transferase component Bud32/DNA-binding beta-propeller fold protein YncE
MRTCAHCGTALAGAGEGEFCPNCIAALAFGAETIPRKPGRPPLHFGDHEILDEIAHGGMGVVYKARHLKLNRTVAVKMALGGQLASPVELHRFRGEAEAAARLQHPNIVAIYEVGEHDGLPYFSMEYVEGKTLTQVVRDGPLPARRAAGYLKAMAQAIDHAHQHGVLHRDLKPSNVLIDRLDRPRITDFGLAKRLAAAAERSEIPVTVTGQVLGTPAFIPPEQVTGRSNDVGVPADIYSLGAILYFLVTGCPPFSGQTLAETLSQVLHAQPVSPRRLNPGVPRDLETICLKCLQKQSQRRYATAHELAEDLERFLQGQPIEARPVGRFEKAWLWCRRYPAIASLGLSLLITLAAFVVVLGFLEATQRRPKLSFPRQIATRPSYQYDGPVQQLIAIDEDTLSQSTFGLGANVAIDPKNNNIWCPILVSNAVLIRDGITGAVITNLTLADCPGGAAFDARHRLVWVTAQCGVSSNTNYPSNDLIWAIDADSYTVIAGSIPCGGINGGPEVVNPVTGRFYHNVKGAQRVDPRTFIPTRASCGVIRAANPTTGFLYAQGPSNILQIVDGNPDPEIIFTNVSLPFGGGSTCIAVDPARNRIYAGNDRSRRILILDAGTGEMDDAITLAAGVADFQGVRGLAIDSTRNRLFVSGPATASKSTYLFVIEGDSQHVLKLSGVVNGPVINPALNKVYLWIGE